MAAPLSLGQFEQLVMTAILARGENAYGVTIHSKLEELVRPKAVSLGAVYATLDRLEDKRFWFDRAGRPTPRSVAQLADDVTRDADLVSVLALWEGRPDVPVAAGLAVSARANM